MSKCGEKTEVYSRVCGYFRPVSNVSNPLGWDGDSAPQCMSLGSLWFLIH